MKTITAKFAGTCAFCGTPVKKGERCLWSREAGVAHTSCRPSAEPEADREYWAGRAAGHRYSVEREVYGPELAEAFAIEDELAAYNRGEDY